MEEWQQRTKLLLGQERLEKLRHSRVLVAGLGGVGAWTTELLCRAGIGSLTIVDGDVIQPSNRNRQLLALKSTEGHRKVLLMKERLLDINPEVGVEVIDLYLEDDAFREIVLAHQYDYVVDAIDTLTPKIHLIKQSLEAGWPLVSSMGSGGKTDPSAVRVDDIDNSYNCRLAAILRKKLHRMGIRNGFKVVYSIQKTDKESVVEVQDEPNKKSTVGTISYMPPLFGCYCAGVVIQDLVGLTSQK